MKKLEIIKEDLSYNINLIKSKLKDSNTKIIAVVKANGMGLGLVQYSEFLIENGIKTLAVSTCEEAIALRKANIDAEILMLSEVCEDEIEVLVENNIILTIGNLNEKEFIEKVSQEKQIKTKVFVKIDTGFGRYGFLYFNEEEILKAVENTENIEVVGVFTHFSKSVDKNLTSLQFERFFALINKIKEVNNNIIFSASNGTAALLYPEMQLDAVRIGSAFQGRVNIENHGLKKIGKLKTKIVSIKEVPKGYNISYSNAYKTKKKTLIAVIPVGYIDGFNLKNSRDSFEFKDNIVSVLMEIKKIFTKPKLSVKINDKIFNVIGRLGMHHAIIDITGEENIKIGDEVTLDISPIYVNINIEREYI